MKNTQENKERFFALYWGQLVISDLDNIGCLKTYPVDRSNMYRIDETYLSLKSISDISGEDLQSLVSIYWEDKNPKIDPRLPIVEVAKETKCADYLRSKSYLLPFGDITVEEILEFGWAKV